MTKREDTSKFKGNFLEDLVAELHKIPGCKVQIRVPLPTISDPSSSREIDVLLTGTAMGYPLRRAIECRNRGAKVGVEEIGAYLDKLQDVGIPPQTCIFVMTQGYTKGALRRGAKAGLFLLELHGLNQDRVSSAIESAFKYIIYLVPSVKLVQMFGDRTGNSKVITSLRYHDLNTGRDHYVLENLWKKWLTEKDLRHLGLHHIQYEIPQDPSLFKGEEQVEPRVIFFGLRVIAAVVEIKGTAKKHSLVDAITRRVGRTSLQLTFNYPGASQVHLLQNDLELQEFLGKSEARSKLVITNIPLPRLIYFQHYWPPTMESLIRSKEIYASGKEPTFEAVEGDDLSRAWEFSFEIDSLSTIPDFIPEKLYPPLTP